MDHSLLHSIRTLWWTVGTTILLSSTAESAAGSVTHSPVPILQVAPSMVKLPVTEATGLRISHVSTRDGLSQTRVSQIVQDDKGFMWFGTQYGLNRYDGYEFRLYVHDPETLDSLSGAFVFSLFKDRSGDLWVGCNQALDRFDPRTEHFTHYKIDGAATLGLHATVVHISQDNEGLLWLATGDGLHRLDPATGQIVHFRNDPADPGSLSTNDVKWSGEDREGRFWVGTANGLDEFNRQDGKVIRHIALPDPEQVGFFEDRKGAFWIVHASGTGLALYDAVNNTVIPYSFYPDDPAANTLTGIMGVVEDDSGDLWLGSPGMGLLRFDGSRRRMEWFRNQPYDSHSIGENKVIALFRDRNGGIWAGLHATGIAHFSTHSFRFEAFKHDPADPNSLTLDFVNAVFEDNNHTLWIGNDIGINRIDRNTGKRTLVPAGFSRNPMVISIAQDQMGWMWFGTYADGLRSLDPQSGNYRTYRHSPSDAASLSNNEVHRIFVDHQGTVWVATDDGLDRLDRTTGTFQTYKVQTSNRRRQRIASIAEDSSGRLWLGTAESGLLRFDPISGDFTIYRADPEHPEGLRDNTVQNVYVDKADVIWAGTQNGLNRLDPKTGRFTAYDTRNGLPGNTVSCIREDAHENLWLSTNNGISRFDPKTQTFANYSESDGLPGNDFTGWSACDTAPDGEIFFAGFAGAVGFYPDQLIETPPQTPVVLTSLDIGGIRARAGNDAALTQAISYARNIILTHQQNQFSLTFAGLRYANPASIRYRYRLLGFNHDWLEVDSHNRRATYTNVPAGTYTFQVEAASGLGQWSEPGESLKIQVLPAWWATWWFRGIYISLAVMGLWGIYRFRVGQLSRQMIARMEERIRERTRIARDLHDTLLQGLLSASLQLSVAKSRMTDDSAAKPLVERVFALISQMIQESRNVVSGLRTRDSQSESFEADVSLIPRVAALSSHAEFKLVVEGSPRPLKTKIREELYWIARESIVNALRHSKAKLIEVLIEYGNEQFRLVVRDDGVGIDARDLRATGNGHWGLSGMSERARRIGAKIEISSGNGAGTEVDVILQNKLAYEKNRDAAP